MVLKLAVGIVDRAQQLCKMRRLLDRPYTVEGRTENIQVTTREEADRHYPFRHFQALTTNPNSN
ncbi:MAG TPA: hypothetical protein VE820_01595 [Sphingomicrobium sp.]|jgi:hypothetical protein|nr:hypothetical protein [Sphingomicrobium sp.]